MERESSRGLYAELHEKAPFHNGSFSSWSAKRTKKHPVRFDEAVQIGVSTDELTPWDPFTTEVNASPLPPTDQGGEQ